MVTLGQEKEVNQGRQAWDCLFSFCGDAGPLDRWEGVVITSTDLTALDSGVHVPSIENKQVKRQSQVSSPGALDVRTWATDP